jgi:hypothetical protein
MWTASKLPDTGYNCKILWARWWTSGFRRDWEFLSIGKDRPCNVFAEEAYVTDLVALRAAHAASCQVVQRLTGTAGLPVSHNEQQHRQKVTCLCWLWNNKLPLTRIQESDLKIPVCSNSSWHCAWFQASAAVQQRSSPFSDVRQSWLVVCYQQTKDTPRPRNIPQERRCYHGITLTLSSYILTNIYPSCNIHCDDSNQKIPYIGIRSGERAGHFTGPRPIHRSGTFHLRTLKHCGQSPLPWKRVLFNNSYGIFLQRLNKDIS